MRARLATWLQANPLLRKALILSGGTGLAQLVGVAAMPVLSRLYAPEDFAATQLFLAFTSVALPLLTLRYELAVPTPKKTQEGAYLLLAGLLAAFFLAPLAAWVLLEMVRRDRLGLAVLPLWTPWAMLAYLWLGALFFSLRYWLIRQGEFGLLGRVIVDRGVARALVQVALGWWPAGVLGMLLGEMAGQLAGVRQMLRLSLSQLKEHLSPVSPNELVRQVRIYKQFPLYGLPSALLDNLALALPLFLVSTLYGPLMAGYFALVQRAFAVPLTLLGQSIADSFHSALSELYRSRPDRIGSLFAKTVRTLALMALLLGGALALFSLWGFPLVFGQRWRPAGEIALWMIPWLVAQMIVSPVSRLVLVLDGQQLKLIYDFTVAAATVLAYALAARWGLASVDFLKLLVGFNVLAYALYYVLLVRLVRTRVPR